MTLSAGTVIADRFEIRALAGRGGMSVVYRALDRAADTEVALKITDCDFEAGAARFAREAQVLAELRHPAIVRYLAHGVTPSGDHYLAMEWLEGQDLSGLLRRRPLAIAECVTIARRIAEALDFAHRHAVVHRDVKPSNIFLPGGEVASAKMLDFGVARLRRPLADLTRTGIALGTPAYMSPEQARGDRDVGPATDVYSLGCVLYACLTRRKPFREEDLAARLARAALEEPPRPSEHRQDIPPALDDLVRAMISSRVADRPSSAAEVASALSALGPLPETGPPPSEPLASLTDDEQRLHAVVLASDAHLETKLLARVAAEFGGTLEQREGGLSVIRMWARHAATDLAARAARCALAVRAEAPGVLLAVATGRDSTRAERSGTSTVIERASRSLPDVGEDVTLPELAGAAARAGPRPIGIDEVTADLLDARFVVAREDGHLVLHASRAAEPAVRTLLGKPTSCVARSGELATLEALFAACVEEREPKVALVVAPAGVGKSRVRQELLARLTRSGRELEVILGQGDPLGAGAPFRILGGALRRALGVAEGEAAALAQEKVRRRVARDLGADPEVDRVAELVGELTGVPFPDSESVQLRAARQDALLMGDRLRWAFARWLRAACEGAPVLLVLEDLHWGDPSTVALLDATLGELTDSPLLILAFARPEVDELFPRLFATRGVHQIRLAPLGERASRNLIEQVLGKELSGERVDAMIARAAGNALCLEEMIRAAAAGRDAELPETVLAIVQARLEKMEPEARRVLRAASVFGRRFWEAGVARLLGEGEREGVREWLEVLAAEEVVARHAASVFPAERELSFRHDLMRDAAYAMLTDRDRVTGHRLAAEWLERAGEGEALVLAEHLERGGELARARVYYGQAAERALATNDFAAVQRAVERALRCRPSDRELAVLRLAEAEALNWQGRFVDAAARGLEAAERLEAGSSAWYAAIGEVANASGVQGDGPELRALASRVAARSDELDERGIAALTRLSEQLIITGQIELADALLARVDRRVSSFDAQNPGIVARILSAKGLRACFDGDTGANLELVRAAAERFGEAGDLRNECIKRERVGYGTMDLGAYAEAEAVLSGALESAERLGLRNVVTTAQHNLGLTLARLGRFEEAADMERTAAEAFARSGNRRMEGAAHEYLALIHLEAGDARAAEIDARRALVLAREPALLPLNEAESLAILARALLAQDRVDEALAAAEAGLEGLERLGGIDDGEAIIRLACAEALFAVGREDDAERAIAAAAERLHRRAAKIDARWKESFLTNVPENAQTLRLATRA